MRHSASIEEFRRYHSYLTGRSILGGIYRSWLLYPTLARYTEGKTLDVGCGIGDFLKFRGTDTIGTDINPINVQWCVNHGLVAKLSGETLPFEIGSFDSVVLDNVLEHLSSPEQLLGEIRRVLKAGGRFVVGVPGRRGFDSDPDHVTFYDQSGLVEILSKTGFEVEKIIELPFPKMGRVLKQYCIYAVCRRSILGIC
jgi:SAM-dependent methyltransferase